MKGSPKVIDVLNDILTAELTAINQYFIHAKMCQNWGYHALYKYIYEESITEMKHADCLIERILFLEGVPNVQRYNKVNVGENVGEQLKLDLQMEQDAVTRFRKGIEVCRDQERDETSGLLLERMLKTQEKHLDWIETQLELINQVTLENYLAQQMWEQST